MANGWQEVCISLQLHHPAYRHTGFHIGAADPASHKIYIWDISNDGQFASALDGGREPLVHVHVRVTAEYTPPKEFSLTRTLTVAFTEIAHRIHHEPRQHPPLALTHARTVGCVCWWI
jgi:hypothetical protein